MAKTYWHLEPRGRMPSEYEIATSELLYYRTHGFEVDAPSVGWFDTHQRGSPLVCSDWESFEDPRRTTYGTYVALQREQEAYLDGVLDKPDDDGLADEWLALFDRLVAPLRFPCHGLHMLAGYAGHLAPGGRIVAALTFQAADEMRRVHRLAYRLAQLREIRPELGERSRADFEGDAVWQPLRELVERLLVCWDWGESFCVTNLLVKPWFDGLFMETLARTARARGDETLARMLGSLGEDCAWHRAWSSALLRSAIDDQPENSARVTEWLRSWLPRVESAFEPLAPLVAGDGPDARPLEGVRRSWVELCTASGLPQVAERPERRVP